MKKTISNGIAMYRTNNFYNSVNENYSTVTSFGTGSFSTATSSWVYFSVMGIRNGAGAFSSIVEWSTSNDF